MAGRPTTYDEKYIGLAKEYLEQSKDKLDMIIEKEIITTKKIQGRAFVETKTSKIGQNNVKLPSIEGLAKFIGASRSSIYLWRDEYSEFSDILDEILEEQAERLINMGLSGQYNPTISKLLLAKHGYVEKVENTNKNIDYEVEDEYEFKDILKNNGLI